MKPETHPSEMSSSLRAPQGVTLRAVLLGSLLAAGNVYWILISDTHQRDSGTALPLFITPVFMLFLLASLNLLLQRLLPGRAFTPGELLVMYLMPVITTSLAAHDMIQNFFGIVGYAEWGATDENRWRELFHWALPRWLVVLNRHALEGFYQGARELSDPANYEPWLLPLLYWGGFTFVLMWSFLCLGVLVRRRWTVEERLSFPVIQLPLALARPQTFFRERLLWAGFSVMMAIGVMNQLHLYFPAVPGVPAGIVGLRRIDTEIRTWPWNQMGPTWIGADALSVGLAYFVPLDLIFSCWVFYVIRKLVQVGAFWMAGSGKATDFPYVNEQACGAWIAMGLLALWSVRAVLKQATVDLAYLRFRRGPGDPMPASLALLGLLGAIGYFGWFSHKAGMEFWVCLPFFSIVFLLALAISRVRAELGTPHEIYFVNPLRTLVTLLGSDALDTQNLTVASLYYWFNRCYRPHPMPNYLEAFKLSDYLVVNKTRLVAVLMWAVVIGVVGSYWVHLHLSYQEGSLAKLTGFSQWGGLETWNWLVAWLQSPQEVEAPRVGAFSFGVLLTFALKAMRGRFLWWPLHPAGYALAISYAMEYFWCAFLLTWIIKGLILRYGGMRGQRRWIPFFLGLILGDYTRRALAIIIDPYVLR